MCGSGVGKLTRSGRLAALHPPGGAGGDDRGSEAGGGVWSSARGSGGWDASEKP